MGRIEIEEEPGSKEKRVVFKKGRKSRASKLYGSLKHDEKEIDELIKAETWNL